jgi:CubicO group peptidase (beta-lactamase class C family)
MNPRGGGRRHWGRAAGAALLCAAVGLSGCDSRQQELTRKVDALMQAYQGEVPGASVLVLRDGAPLIRRAYGLADLAPRTPATPATNYRLASMTKEFTAAAVLLLAQEGRLSLDDVLTRWLPHLPPVADNITIRELLNHTSGVIDYEELMAKDTQVPLHDSDVLHLLEAQNRTYFPPGSAYRYSDSGYALLALIVARVSGGDFASFLRQRIFLPLQMRNSVAYEAGISSVADRAFGYSLEDGAWVRTDQSLTSAVLGDGGIYSSIADLARWDAALYGSQLLKPEWRRLAFAPQVATDDPNVSYGFGWRVTGETVWHSGETLGFRNVIVRWPQRHFTVVILTNRNDPAPYTLALSIATLFYPDAGRVRASEVVVGPDSGARPLPKS